MNTRDMSRLTRALLVCLGASIVAALTGCHRSEDDFDDRPLAQRPQVETVAPENKKDIFRP